MKNFTTLFFLLIATLSYAQISLPMDFESTPVTADFIDFDGGTATVIANPQSSGDNTSSTVAQIVRDGGQPWSGSKLTLASNLDFTTNNTFTMKVFSPAAGIPILLKLESSGGGAAPDNIVNTTVANEWETLTWNYAGTPSNTYDQLVFMFDFGTVGDGTASSTFLFDDVEFIDNSGGLAQVDLPVNFDDANVFYDLVGFEGNTSEVVVDPTDPNNMVGQAIKSSTAQPWAGTTMGGSGLASAIPLTATNSKVSARVWAPDGGIQIRVKVENSGDPAISVETEATYTTANTWETLEFDFSNEAMGTAAINYANTYDKISIFFNYGVDGATAGEKTYYWDDVEFVTGGGGGSGIVLPVDFESTTINYAFGDFDGGELTLIANPDPSGINTSANVAKMVKNAGQPWAGSSFVMDAPIDFAINKIFKMKVWAPAVGTKVLLKVENSGNGAINYEQEVETTTAMAWEELTFDYSTINTDESYDKVVLIFELGTVGDGTAAFTYYVDDLDLVMGGTTGSGIVLPVDFESTTINYAFGDFDGGELTLIANPDPSGINTSANVAKMVKNAGQPWAGSSFVMDAPIDFSTNKTFKMKVWAPAVGTKVLLKVENSGNGAINYEQEVATTTAMAWEEMTFDYSAINTAESYDKVVLIFELGTVGDGTAAFTYYVDDLDLVMGGTTGSGIVLPVDFESTTINYVFGDFDGGVLTKETNPDQSGINTSANVAKMVKNDGQPWAGSSFVLDGAIDFSVNKAFKMKVWAPAVGTKVLLKVENSGNAAINYEQEVETTTAMAWEELTFDYSAINTAESYDKIVLIFELGTVGDGSAAFTYYVDDIELVMGNPPPMSEVDLPITFEDTMIDYNLADFEGNISEIVVDPTDPNNMVGKATKTDTAQPWAGTTNGGLGLINPIPFAMDDTKMTVRVWSPDAGIQIRLKAEDASNDAISVETEATTTVAMAWETLEFDFSNEAAGTAAINFANTYDKISIFFNFGVDGATAGEKTYYWDDIEFGARVTVVDIIVNSMAHDTLEAAVIAAQLDDDLSAAGPFTVFAPTDDAFAALSAGTLDALLSDPTGDLAQLLLYHVLSGRVMSGDLTDGQSAPTLQGGDIDVTITGGDVFINQALVTMADIEADNGVVHVINAVLMIPVGLEIVNAAESGIKISPNPSSTFFNIEFPETLNESVNMFLFDVNGKLLKEGKIIDQTSRVDVSDLNSGMYFLRMDTGEVSYFQKVMISK